MPLIQFITEKGNWQKGIFSFYFAAATLIIIPLYVHYLPPFMIAWVICWIIEASFRSRKELFANKSILVIFAGFLFYFLLYSGGLIYSEDKHRAQVILFRSLSLIVFPLILFNPGGEIKRRIWTLLRLFSLSTLVYLIICFSYAFYRSLHIQDGSLIFDPIVPGFEYTTWFLESDLTLFQHPSYVGMFVILSTLISFASFFDYNIRKRYRIIWLIISSLMLSAVYFFSSRATFLSVLIIIPAYFLVKLWRTKIISIIIILVIGFILFFGLVFIKSNKVEYILNDQSNSTFEQKIRMDSRIEIWISAIAVIKKNPLLGAGVGDSCDELKKEYKKRGFSGYYYENLNAHNQFLEVGINSGLIGLLIFITIIGLLVYQSISKANYILGLFLLSMIIFFMFESALNRLTGVAFFSLFSFLLLHLEASSKYKR